MTWDDVKHLCYPGSMVDVPCCVPGLSRAFYVLFAFEEDGDTWLKLSDGSDLPAIEYRATLGWVLGAEPRIRGFRS